MESLMAKKLSKKKAKQILKDGIVRGKAVTKKQMKFFGSIASGQAPKRSNKNVRQVKRKR